MCQGWTWDEMLEEFRALGGVAENIRLGSGVLGRGLFPVNQTLPVLLRVPPNLLIPVGDIEFPDERIRIRESANIGERERNFFEKYESAFSWGGGGRSDSAAYLERLDELPSEVRALLISDFGFGKLLEGDLAERIGWHFLRSRQIQWDNTHVAMPLVELANHDPKGLPYEGEVHLTIAGRVRDEILVCYGIHDCFSIFHTFGFVSREPEALSLPVDISTKAMELTIGQDTSRQARRGTMRMPQLDCNGNAIKLSYLTIGHQKFPKLSKGIFRTLMRDAGMKNPDEIFDRIVRLNGLKFLKLLQVLEPHQGEMILALRKMVHLQLEAMSHCVGAREPDVPAIPDAKA